MLDGYLALQGNMHSELQNSDISQNCWHQKS